MKLSSYGLGRQNHLIAKVEFCEKIRISSPKFLTLKYYFTKRKIIGSIIGKLSFYYSYTFSYNNNNAPIINILSQIIMIINLYNICPQIS